MVHILDHLYYGITLITILIHIPGHIPRHTTGHIPPEGGVCNGNIYLLYAYHIHIDQIYTYLLPHYNPFCYSNRLSCYWRIHYYTQSTIPLKGGDMRSSIQELQNLYD
jgi:hypothetical protein